MGPKKHSPLEDPPAASSSSGEEEEEEEVSDAENQEDEQKDEEPEEEEEEEEDEDEEESEDDEEVAKPVSQNSQKLPLTQPQPQPEASSSDDDSDSEPEPEKVIKPMATKPMETKKSAPPKPSKRPIESSPDAKSSKKSKTKESAEPENDKKKGEESSKKLFQRLWSEEDEIAVLKGMIDYNSKKGLDPMSDVNGFYEFVKRSLHVDVTKTQVVDKVKRLKKKFVNNSGRGKKGEDPNFSRPHESKSFQLSKKIWSHLIQDDDLPNKSSNGKLSKSPGKAKKPNVKEGGEKEKKTNVKEEEEKQVVSVKADEDIVMAGVASDFSITELVKGGLDEAIVRQGLESLGHAKRAEFEDKWSRLKVAETELHLQRIGLLHEHSKLITDAYKLSRR